MPTSSDGHFLPSYPERAYRSPTELSKSRYVLALELQIGLPREFFKLIDSEQKIVLDYCNMLLRDSGQGTGKYDEWCGKWQHELSSFSNSPLGAAVTFSQLHGILSTAIAEYSQTVWSQKANKMAESIEPLPEADMDSAAFHNVQYIWSEGRFICIHTLALKHKAADGTLTPWSFSISLPSGQKISTTNVAELRWRVVGS